MRRARPRKASWSVTITLALVCGKHVPLDSYGSVGRLLELEHYQTYVLERKMRPRPITNGNNMASPTVCRHSENFLKNRHTNSSEQNSEQE